MPRSLAMSAYMALASLAGGRGEAQPPRPDEPVLWVHADGPGRLPPVIALAERLAGEGVTTLLTLPRRVEATALPASVILRPAPHESGSAVRAFLDHWRPDLLLWVGGGLRPGLLSRTQAPMLLVEGAPEARLLAHGSAWPGLARRVVPLFERALVRGDAAAERLSRAGFPESRLEIVGPLDAPAPILPCNDRERRDLAQALGARPVWLAADTTMAELSAVLMAHRIASRSAHRLLLILAPRVSDDGPAMASLAAEAGFRVMLRADGEEPEDNTQVYLVDGPAEMGLWLRLAPVAFLGSTMPGSLGSRHPFEAAALGSALLHGPFASPHAEAWGRLDHAGAAKVVMNGMELGRAIESLLAPDRAAAMAHAGWDVATQGAEVANRVASLVYERIFGDEPDPSAAGQSLNAADA